MAASPALAAPTDLEIVEHPDLRGANAGYAPHDIDGKPYMMKQVGAGLEHAYVATCGENILIAGVGSYERDTIGVTPDMHAYGRPINTNDKLQSMVVAAKLTKDGLEVGGAYYVLPELSGGNRNDLVATQLSPAMMVLESTDDNCSDRDYQDMLVRTTGTGWRVNLTGSCNGNGADVAWASYFDIACANGECVVAAGPKAQVSQGQIERYRAQSFQLGPDVFMTIGTEGDTQPPRDGISATIYNGDTLEMISSTTIAGAVTTPVGTFYSTMSHVAQLGPDSFLVTYQQRNGRQRREGKGGTTFMMGVLQASPTGVQWLVEPKPGLIQGFAATHHGSCNTMYGEASAAQPAAFLISASPTGGTPANGAFVTYANGALQVASEINLATNIDSGLLSNYSGENPGNQGKNSLYCATIENPSFRVSGGYRPDVQQFVVVPATSRVAGPDGLLAEKLALDVVLVPAVYDSTIDPTADDETATGCGCSTDDPDVPSLAVLGFACAFLVRRRRAR